MVVQGAGERMFCHVTPIRAPCSRLSACTPPTSSADERALRVYAYALACMSLQCRRLSTQRCHSQRGCAERQFPRAAGIVGF